MRNPDQFFEEEEEEEDCLIRNKNINNN